MKRSSYRGEHKGSTLKARTKIYGMRVLNIALSVVLVVGLAPSISFAGEQAVESPAAEQPQQPVEQPQAPQEEQQVVQEEQSQASQDEQQVAQDEQPQQQAEEQAQQPESNTQGILTLQGGATSGGENAKGKAVIHTANDDPAPSIAITAGEGTQTLALGEVEACYANGSLLLQISVANVTAGAEITILDNSEAKFTHEMTAEETTDGVYSCSYEVPSNGSSGEVVHSVMVSVKSSSKATPVVDTKYVVIDNQAPRASVEWKADANDNWIGSVSESAVSFVTNEYGQKTASAIATIKVEDYNPSFPEGENVTALDGDGTQTTKIDKNETDEKLTVSVVEDWKQTKAPSTTAPGEWTCTLRYAANAELVFGVANTAILKVKGVDKGGEAATDATDLSGTLTVTSVDKAEPQISSPLSSDPQAPTYMKDGSTQSVIITDDHYSKTKMKATLGEADISGSLPESPGDSLTIKGGTTPLTTAGQYTLAIDGTDDVNNGVSYKGYVYYDPDPPTVSASYKSTEGESSAKTLANDGSVFVKEATTVTVNVADAVALDTSSENTYVKYQKGSEEARNADIVDGVATIELSFEDDAVYTITAKAADKAGNVTDEYAATITMDNTEPTIAVVWAIGPESEAVLDGGTKYFTQRVAEVTITDKYFDEATATAGLTYTGGVPDKDGDAIKWTQNGDKYTAIIRYSETKKNCVLNAAYTSKSGVVAQKYESGSFNILARPVIDVQMSHDTDVTLTRNTSLSETETRPIYVFEETTPITVTVTVRDAAFNDGDYTWTYAAKPSAAATLSDWTSPEGSITHTRTITYSKDCAVDALKVALNSSRNFVGSGQQEEGAAETCGANNTSISDNAWTYTKTIGGTSYSGFWIDNTPPTLVNVTYNPADFDAIGNQPENRGIRYYKGDKAASASIEVKEKHLNFDATPITVTLRKTVDGGDPEESAPLPTFDYDEGTLKYNGIIFGKESAKVAQYALTITGKDLNDKALVSTSDEGEVKTVMGDDNSYTSTIAIDDENPVLNVGLATADGATSYKGSNNVLYTNNSATATITVTDAFVNLADDATNKIVINASYTEGDSTGSENLPCVLEKKNGVYTATLDLPAATSSTYRTYTLTVSGKDAVGNDLVADGNDEDTKARFDNTAHTYTATVVVDKVAPKLTIGFAPYITGDNPQPYKSVVKEGVRTYYYNAVTSSITVTGEVEDEVLLKKNEITASIGTTTKTGPAADEKSFKNIFGDSGFTINDNGSYAIHVGLSNGAQDISGGGLEPSSAEGNIAGDGMQDGAYNSVIVYDKTRPTVSAQYKVGESGTETNLPYDADGTTKPLVNGDVTVIATFNDGESGIDAGTLEFKYKTAAATAWKSVTAEKIADNKYSFTISPEADTDDTYVISIDGSDIAGNKLAGDPSATTTAAAYTAQVEIDKIDPVVTYTTAVNPITPMTASDKTDYFGTSVSVTISVTDANFDKENATPASLANQNVVVVDGESTVLQPANWSQIDTNEYTYTVDFTTSGEHTVAINVHDKAGNALSGVNYKNTDGAKLFIDTDKPNIDVVMDKPRYNQHDSTAAKDFYAETVTATITVTDSAFDLENSKITVSSDVAIDASKLVVSAWAPPSTSTPGVHTATITFPDSKEEKAYSFTVLAKDKAGRSLEYKYGNDDTGHAEGGNKTTAATGEEAGAVSFASSFEVDSLPPVVTVNYDQEKAGTIDGVDYYGAAPLIATVVVTEQNFADHDKAPSEFIKVKMMGGEYGTTPVGVTIDDAWSHDAGSGKYTAKITLPENGVSEGYEFKVENVKDNIGRTAETFNSPGIVVDGQKPIVTKIELLDAAGNAITPVGAFGGVDYWNSPTLQIKATVYDTHFDSNNSPIAPSGQVVTPGEDRKWTSEGNGVWTTVVAFSENVTFDGQTISVSDLNLTLGDLVYTASGNKRVNHKTTTKYQDFDGTVGGGFILDVTDPEITDVSWSAAPVGAVSGVDYYGAKPTLTVTVRENNFDKAEADKLFNVVGLTNKAAWVQQSDPAEWKATLTFGENRVDVSDVTSSVALTTIDKVYLAAQNSKATIAGHTNAYDYKNGVASGANAGEGKHSPADRFVVDMQKPTVSVSMSEPVQNTFDGHDFYGTATDGALIATITVKDYNFDSSTAASPVNAGNASWSGTWSTSDNFEYTTTVAFAENVGTASDLAMPTVADFVYTASNRTAGDHVASYDYGANTSDKAGNPVGGSDFILDLTAPSLSTAFESTDFSTRWDSDGAVNLFYNTSGAGIDVTLTDANGVHFASAEAPFALSGSGENLGYSSVHSVSLIQGEDVGDRDAKNQQMRTALIRLTDYANNYSIWNITETGQVVRLVTGQATESSANAPIGIRDGSSVHPSVMVLDTIAPSLSWGAAPTEGQYYNSAQSAVLNVNEMNFDYLQSLDGGRAIATVTHYANDAGRGQSDTIIPASAFDGAGNDWATTIPFNQEGHYTVLAQFVDIAGNASEPLSLGEFTLDWTAPTCTISWDNNDARNGNYYKSARTATITVTEHNFLASDFTVETTGSVGGWSSNGDTHTCVVTFSTDGRYTLTVNGHDRAGNAMATMTEPEFIVDLTAPTIDFSNVTAQTAYGDVIEPVINYHDEANFDSNGMQWTLTGNKNGAQTFAASQGSSGNDGNVTFSDFPRQVEADDIYTLQAHLTDMAGNEADGNITFSVNRFGSNFIILDKDTFSKGYLEKPIEVRVQEINVSGAKPDKDQSVTITKDLTTTNLKKKSTGTPSSDGFYIESGSDSAGWSSYTYHIGTDNFAKHDSTGAVVKKDGQTLYDDGSYHVIISSNDTAENLNSSASYYDPTQHKTTSAEVSFILDSAMPIIDNINISSGQTYDANAMKEVSFIVTDNTGTPDVTVVLDGETIDVTPGMGGACSLGLDQIPPKAWTPRNLEITVVDSANNVVTAKVENFHWTTDFLELNLFFVIGGVVVVAAAVVGGVMFVRRRNSVPTL